MGNTKILEEAKNLWMKLNLRGAILTSLSLQVFLILFAPNRKKWSNWWFATLMWSAYMVADSVAVYALGLIAKAQIIGGTSDSEVDAYGDLLAFWAPFLLLHLGGPDTITAFALEDNELWGRHLLNLLFQLGTACYVFYQSLPSNKLIVPTILMFIGGTIKYIARTRALYLVSSSKFRDSLLPPANPGEDYPRFLENYFASLEYATDFTTHVLELSLPEDQRLFPHVRAENKKNLDDRTVIKTAFFYFTTFKGLLVDLIFSFQELNRSRDFFFSRTMKDAFRVIEAELNFFYDVLYTKAAVVHCTKGYLFRAISIGSIVTAFASFHVLNKHGFHEYDVQITYALLLGAVGLEFVALGMLIFSDWTIARIGTSEEHSRSLFQGSIFIEFLLKFKFESSPFALDILHARWSKSVCQYNLIDSQLRKRPKGINLLLCYIPLGELFDDLTSGRVKYSEKLGELIFEELTRKASIANDYQSIKEMCAARGKWALENTKTRRDCKDLLPSIRDVDYGESLLLWHLATELCHSTDTDESTNHHRESSKVLSDYMLYLVIKQPGMMSAVAGIVQIRFRDTCADAYRFFNKFHESKTEITSRDACQNLLDVRTDTNFKPADVRGDKSKSVLFDACILAKELRKFGGTKWVIVSEVWVELLAYAAIHCRPYVHAQQLSKGGELVTLVWLLMVHLGFSEQFQIRMQSW